MKKIILLSVVGLLLGMAGAVGIVIVREKQARVAAAQLAADSTAAVSAHAVGAPAESATADSAAGVAAMAHSDSLTGPGVDPTVSAHDSTTAVPEAVPSADESGPTTLAVAEPSPGEERLARIFAAMRPDEAAEVLEKMTDPEIRRLLSHLRERQAAAIMSSISPERAAVISSAVIRGERSTP